jgi:HEAT repeat protein
MHEAKRTGIYALALTLLIIIALLNSACGQMASTSKTDKLLLNLSSNDSKIRAQAAWELGKIGEERAVEPLIVALEDNDRNVREWAALALAKIGAPAFDPLLKAMKGKNDSTKWQAAAILGMKNDTNATDALCSVLKSNNSTVRYWAAAALGQIRDDRSRDSLISALTESNETVRDKIGWALAAIPGKETVDLLIELLKDENCSRNAGAARSLGYRADATAVEPLIAALEEAQDPLRRDAIGALAAIGKPATAALINALNESGNRTQEAAAEALEKIKDERAVEPLILAFKKGDTAVRRSAAEALAATNESSAVEPMISILQDSAAKKDLRSDAAWALGIMGDQRAKAPLIATMSSDPNNEVRMSAAKALKSIDRISVPVYKV